jgi:hypothetical protein
MLTSLAVSADQNVDRPINGLLYLGNHVLWLLHTSLSSRQMKLKIEGRVVSSFHIHSLRARLVPCTCPAQAPRMKLHDVWLLG